MKKLSVTEMKAVQGGWRLLDWIKRKQNERRQRYEDIWAAAGL